MWDHTPPVECDSSSYGNHGINNGATWTTVETLADDVDIYCMLRLDDGTILLACDDDAPGSRIYRSVDDGLTWTAELDMAASHINNPMDGVICSNGDVLWGNGPYIYRSQDNGDTWALLYTFAIDNERLTFIYALCRAANGDIIAAGESNAGCWVWLSDDNGVSWAEQQDLNLGDDSPTEIFDIIRLPNDDLLICDDVGGIWRSEDDGATWAHVTQVSATPELLCMALLSNGYILVVGKKGGDPFPVIWRSVDNGANWSTVCNFQDPTNVNYINHLTVVIDAGDGNVVVSGNILTDSAFGAVLINSNYGASGGWSAVNLPETNDTESNSAVAI